MGAGPRQGHFEEDVKGPSGDDKWQALSYVPEIHPESSVPCHRSDIPKLSSLLFNRSTCHIL